MRVAGADRAVSEARAGQRVRVAGWSIARQHPRGPEGTVFVTIEDETGDVQAIIPPPVFARYRRALSHSLILIRGRIDRGDGATNLVAEQIEAVGQHLPLPKSHDWH